MQLQQEFSSWCVLMGHERHQSEIPRSVPKQHPFFDNQNTVRRRNLCAFYMNTSVTRAIAGCFRFLIMIKCFEWPQPN